MLFTVGYEGHSADDFVAVLVAAGARVMVDVRQRASSRKAGFGKTALTARLAASGINYVHEPSLGNPKDNRRRFQTGDPGAHARYDDLLTTVGDAAFYRIAGLAKAESVAIMCFEHDHWTCHRNAIAERAELAGVEVVHL